MLGKTIQVTHKCDIYDKDNELWQCKQQNDKRSHNSPHVHRLFKMPTKNMLVQKSCVYLQTTHRSHISM